VPCGNFSNLIAGLYAWKFGMPVSGFIAAMNENSAFDSFIRGRKYTPRPLVSTISPGLDVSVPANYEQLESFYEEAPAVMRNMVFPVSIDEKTTLKTMELVWKRYGLLIDPHTAVAFAAARQHEDAHTVVLATQHPAVLSDIVVRATGQPIDLPGRLGILMKQVDPVALIDPDIEALEGAITSCL
jgi:threonine synthase